MPNSAIDLDKVEALAAKREMHWLPADAKSFHDPDSPELAALIKQLQRANRKRHGNTAG